MRHRDLDTWTLRQMPRTARTAGEGLLMRAGYMAEDGSLGMLGNMVLEQLQAVARRGELPAFLATLAFPVIGADVGGGRQYYFSTRRGTIPLVQCPACPYCSPAELAQVRTRTPAIEEQLPLEKVQTPGCNTIDTLARYLGIDREKTAKAILLTREEDAQFVFVVVRGERQVSAAKLAELIGPTRPATIAEIEAVGAVPGYASPIGLRVGDIVVDALVGTSPNLVAGANETGFHVRNINHGRDFKARLIADVVRAEAGDLCPRCDHELDSVSAEALGDNLASVGAPLLMALADVFHDARGLIWPAAVAPLRVHLMQLPSNVMDTTAEADTVYEALRGASVSVMYDDRDERAGVKFNDADLIGLPFRVVVGEKGLKQGMVELKLRSSETSSLIRKDLLVDELGHPSQQ